MKLLKLPMLSAVFFLVSLPVSGQAPPNEKKLPRAGTFKPGVVVEAVDKNSDGEKAGLQDGDILLGWVRGDAGGQIDSPFDLSWVEIEQGPRGNVTFEGVRSSAPQVWTIDSGYWGITVRPNFAGALLVLYKEGKELVDASKSSQAVERWRRAAASASSESLQLSAWLLFSTAELLSKTEQWKEADGAYQQALALVSASQDKAFLLHAWAFSFQQRGDRDSAEKYYQQAIAEIQEWGQTNLTALSLTNLGFVQMDRSELAKAESYLRQALQIYQKLEPDSLNVASSLLNMGMIGIERGDLANAEEWEQQGLAVFRKLAPGSSGVLIALNNLGEIAKGRGEFGRAQEYYLEALKIKEKSAPNSLMVATFLQNLGVVTELRGNLGQAEQYLLRALTLLKNVKDDHDGVAEGATLASILKDLGNVAQDRGDLAKAEEYFKEALATEEKTAPESLSVAEILAGMGHVSRSRRNLAEAEAYFSRALKIRERFTPGSRQHAETLADLAWTMRQTGQDDVAANLYAQALDALESQMAHLGGSEDVRSGFRAGHERYYQQYIDLLMSRKQVEPAFQIVEHSRARTLLEMLAAARLDVRKGVDLTLLAEERRLSDLFRCKVDNRIRLLSGQHAEKQVQTLDGEIADLLRQYDDVEARIRVQSPGYAALTQTQPLNSQALQRLLPDGTLLLEYSLGESHSYVFGVTSNSLNGYELPGRMEIEGKATRLYRLLTERSRILSTENDSQRRTRLAQTDAEFESAARELSRMLLGPVAAALQQRRLLIISDGALQYIPFAALPTPELSARKTYYPLIVQHEIVNLPSASILAFLRQNTTASKEVAVFADPVFDGRDSRVKSRAKHLAAFTDADKENVSQDSRVVFMRSTRPVRDLSRSLADMDPGLNGEIHLPRLAFTRDEAKAILAVVPQESSIEAIDFDASRKRATSGELARYRVVHFATHALVDNIHPELSGLVLSLVDQRGEPADGFLDLQDIYNLDLSADLVVLSACETALGKEIKGEGMIGLTRGFMYAGASGVLATLWKVNDFATAKLMAHFYKAMERDGMKPAQALRQAQLALWREQSSSAPYYWAGFILQGGWQ